MGQPLRARPSLFESTADESGNDGGKHNPGPSLYGTAASWVVPSGENAAIV